jgi:hypothetical protein
MFLAISYAAWRGTFARKLIEINNLVKLMATLKGMGVVTNLPKHACRVTSRFADGRDAVGPKCKAQAEANSEPIGKGCNAAIGGES